MNRDRERKSRFGDDKNEGKSLRGMGMGRYKMK